MNASSDCLFDQHLLFLVEGSTDRKSRVTREYVEIARDNQLGGMSNSSSLPQYMVSSLNNSLVINEAQLGLQGVYMCQASNGIGEPISKNIRVVINSKLKVITTGWKLLLSYENTFYEHSVKSYDCSFN